MGKSTLTKQKILVVDDEPAWRDLLSFELSSQGFDVSTASCASEALIYLRDHDVDLLLSDIRMPGEMDGIDMVHVFRKEKPSLKVVFITGYALEEKLEGVLTNRRTFALKKPFSIDELNAAIHKLLKDE